MLFTSLEFFIMLATTFLLFTGLLRLRMAKSALLVVSFASLVFIGWWNPLYLPVILFSVAGNLLFAALVKGGEQSEAHSTSKAILAVGIFLNLALLGTFKYWPWFQNAAAEGNLLSAPPESILPLGISFYTFTQIAFLVDSWRSNVDDFDPLRYFLFVTFFPQLIAGPIVHHREMMPQFAVLRPLSFASTMLQQGVFLFFIGVIKKVWIADTLAISVNQGFSNPESLDFWAAWSTSLGYSLQLYFDFSGYTDMALGLAMMFGITLPRNFNSPYKATSVQDFWRRWHMTLSRFLRDYIYIPLGGNRFGFRREYAAIIATFVIGGIWHGAGITFVIWGLLHGSALVIERVIRLNRLQGFTWVRRGSTFLFVTIAWVFFRAADLPSALTILERMFVPVESSLLIEQRITNEIAWAPTLIGEIPGALFARIPILIFIALLLLVIALARNSDELASRVKSPFVYWAVFVAGVSGLFWGWTSGNEIFLYFNF